MLEYLQQLDAQLLLFLNGLHCPFFDHFMWIVSAKLTWVPMYATLLYILYRNFNFRVATLAVITIALTITYADQVCATLIRPIVERLRPSNLENPLSDFVHIINGKRGGPYGFPSCHAANSFALAFIVMFLFKKRWVNIWLLSWATLNSYSRIYLGVHYPGDLIVGGIVGFSGALLLYCLFRSVLRNRKTAMFFGVNSYPKQIKGSHSTIWLGLLTVMGIAIYSAAVL